ncbi:MAG: hypothetical protein R3C45_09310 [Phycisphaerales bacterium]
MTIALLIPALLSFVLLGAHFLHHGSMTLMAAALATPLMLLVRRWWAARIVQAVLWVAALEWLRTGWVLAGQRMDAGAPWLRMAVILGAVALWTLGSALLLETPRLRRRYRRIGRNDSNLDQASSA